MQYSPFLLLIPLLHMPLPPFLYYWPIHFILPRCVCKYEGTLLECSNYLKYWSKRLQELLPTVVKLKTILSWFVYLTRDWDPETLPAFEYCSCYFYMITITSITPNPFEYFIIHLVKRVKYSQSLNQVLFKGSITYVLFN